MYAISFGVRYFAGWNKEGAVAKTTNAAMILLYDFPQEAKNDAELIRERGFDCVIVQLVPHAIN